MDYYQSNAEVRGVLDQINSGYFNPEDPGMFRDIYNSLVHTDR